MGTATGDALKSKECRGNQEGPVKQTTYRRSIPTRFSIAPRAFQPCNNT
jgi:hypothetical protein